MGHPARAPSGLPRSGREEGAGSTDGHQSGALQGSALPRSRRQLGVRASAGPARSALSRHGKLRLRSGGHLVMTLRPPRLAPVALTIAALLGTAACAHAKPSRLAPTRPAA